ncbi:glycosyltransferase family 87 protein [Nocardioides flavescens]|uniref:DUF2029 domain-containing protein n=1 Tax=Nocardioides flavescens TaxID=2691959 RepID=A0A6L7F0B6_9ACTN|nr:glycosyltransferase family 87 protein [Nocardioides flavescens]MXG90229.1 DUF2029 domain-containing protein [Nocardioides flavescens]
MVTTTSGVVSTTRRHPTPVGLVGLLVLLVALVGAVATQRWTSPAPASPDGPPFAALLFSGLALLSLPVATAALAGGGVAASALTLRAVARESGRRLADPVLTAATLGALLLEPVREALLTGRLDLVLMGLLTWDLLVLRGRWSGVLVGVVAGVALPALLLVVLLVAVGRRAEACRAVSAFAATVLVGVVLRPGEAADFWGPALWSSVLDGASAARLLGGAAALLALALAAWWWRRGARDVGLVLAGTATVLGSSTPSERPWVWAVPLVVVLASRAPRWTAYVVGAVLLVDAYAWLALGLVACSAVLVARTEVSQRRARARSGASSAPLSSPPSKTRSTVSSRSLGDVVVVTRNAVSRSSAASTHASNAGPAGSPRVISTAATSSAAVSQP